MKILITGGTGYLGLRLIEYFAKDKKNQIFATSRKRNKEHTPKTEKIFLLSNKKSNIPPLKDLDLIIHAAGPNASQALQNPKKEIAESRNITKKIIKYAINNNVVKMIYISTAHVYKSPLLGTLSERSKARNTHPYAISNLVGEKEILIANKTRNFNGVIVRLSNAFGRPVSKSNNCWSLLINDISRQIVSTRKVYLKGKGNEKRDFISIENTCRALDHISKIKTKRVIFNVGGNWTPTINEISKLVSRRYKKITGSDSEIFYKMTNRQEISNYVNFLNYKIENLLMSGFKLKKQSNIKEIDDLLKFCIKNFK